MEDITEMYVEEVSASNEIKGFTKSFKKRSKTKKTEDANIKELLNFAKENKIQIGAKVTEKNFKKSNVEKVYVARNCDEMMYKKLSYYAKLLGVDIIKLDINNLELAQKLEKPFLISTVCVRKN